jgi:twitching motility two-component system response regulator PilG
MLPRMDGYQICQIIRRNKEYKKLPVIMLSGKDGLFDRVRGRLAGSTEYITKPFDPNELVRVVRKHLTRKPSRMQFVFARQ